MAGRGITVGGDLDTWIRELPRLGQGDEVRDEWEQVTHEFLMTSRTYTHFITGQLRATSYSVVESRGTRHEGQIWWPATNDDGTHYAIYEFHRTGKRADDANAGENLHRDVPRYATNTVHDTPLKTYGAMYHQLLGAVIRGLEAQVSSWR